METAGLQGIQPEARSVDAVLGLLEADPALPRSNEVSVTLTNSSRLPDEIGFLDSWFEADAEVEQLLGNKRLTRQKRIALVQDELLSTRVAKWAERLAWIALLLHEGEEDAPWEEFLVSARELQAGRPISEVPLMAHVAALTVDANEAQHFQRSNLSRPKPHRARRTSGGVRR